MRTPSKSTHMALIGGEAFFYSDFTRRFGTCEHSPYTVVWDYNEGKPAFCGICFLTRSFESEVPAQLHTAIKNGKTRTWDFSAPFLRHVEAQLGLLPPGRDQNLKAYRASRARAFKTPSRAALPVTAALWKMMGYQPKMASPLLRSLLGASIDDLRSEFDLTLFQAHATLGRGVRQALHYLRS